MSDLNISSLEGEPPKLEAGSESQLMRKHPPSPLPQQSAATAHITNPNPIDQDSCSPASTSESSVVQFSFASHAGPMPPPELLEAYRSISPDLPDRMMRMAEKAQEQSHALEVKTANAARRDMLENWRVVRRGQAFGALIGISALAAAVLIFLIAPSAAGAVMGTVIGGGGIGTLIWAFRYDKSQERREEETPQPPSLTQNVDNTPKLSNSKATAKSKRRSKKKRQRR